MNKLRQLLKTKFRVKKIEFAHMFIEYHLEFKTWYNPFWRLYYDHIYTTESGAIKAFNMQKSYREPEETIILEE